MAHAQDVRYALDILGTGTFRRREWPCSGKTIAAPLGELPAVKSCGVFCHVVSRDGDRDRSYKVASKVASIAETIQPQFDEICRTQFWKSTRTL